MRHKEREYPYIYDYVARGGTQHAGIATSPVALPPKCRCKHGELVSCPKHDHSNATNNQTLMFPKGEISKWKSGGV